LVGGMDGIDEPIKKRNASDPRGHAGGDQTLEELLAIFAGQALEDPLQNDQGTQISFCGIVRGFHPIDTEERPKLAPVLQQGLAKISGGLVVGLISQTQVVLQAGEDHGCFPAQGGAVEILVPELVPQIEDPPLVFQHLFPDAGHRWIHGFAEGNEFASKVSPAELAHGLLELPVGGVPVRAEDSGVIFGQNFQQGLEAPRGAEVEERGSRRQGHPDPVAMLVAETCFIHVDHPGAADLLPQGLPGWGHRIADPNATFMEPPPGDVNLEDLLEKEPEGTQAHAALRAEVGCQGPEIGPKFSNPSFRRQLRLDGPVALGTASLVEAEGDDFSQLMHQVQHPVRHRSSDGLGWKDAGTMGAGGELDLHGPFLGTLWEGGSHFPRVAGLAAPFPSRRRLGRTRRSLRSIRTRRVMAVVAVLGQFPLQGFQ